jgi:hypothetical protein
MHATKKSLLPDDQCPCLQRPSRLKTGGLPLPSGGSATNNAMSIPTAPTCFRSRGGHLNHWKNSNIVAIAVIVVIAIITVVVAIIVVVSLLSPSPSLSLQVAVIVAKTINLSQFLISPMLFCTRKQVAVADAYTTRQKVMGRANQRLGKLLPGLPEDLRFCGFFCVLSEVSVTAWDMMENHSVLPPTSKFLHFLWVLAFMRTYPTNNTTLSSLLGGSNPKTISKYVWLFIWSIFALNKCLVG